jgi:hypothetical protein
MVMRRVGAMDESRWPPNPAARGPKRPDRTVLHYGAGVEAPQGAWQNVPLAPVEERLAAFAARPPRSEAEKPLGTPVGEVFRRAGGYERPGAVANPFEERYRAPQGDPVVALLGPEFAVPDDLQRYKTIGGGGERVRPDPAAKRRTKGPIRNVFPDQPQQEPLGGPPAYAVVDLPTRSAKGKWRGADGQPLSTRIDPSTPTGITQYKDPDSGEWLPQGRNIASYRDEGFEVRDLTLGQAAKEARLENRTPVVSEQALRHAMTPEGGSRFKPASAGNSEGVAGYLLKTTLDRRGRGRAAARQEAVPVYATDSVAEDGQRLFRVGGRYPNDADASSAQMRELIPGAGTAEANPLDLVQRNKNLTRVTPVRLQEAVGKGFQIGAPDPETGAMPFQRPDGSSGLLVPEQIMGKGGVPTGQVSPRFIVVDEGKMPSGEVAYGPGAFLDPGSRAWIEKQADLNPDGVSFWSAMDDIIAAGGTEPSQVRGREVVARLARERGLGLDQVAGTSSSQLADLTDAMRTVENRPAYVEQPVITGMAPRGSKAIPATQTSALHPDLRAVDALYASPSEALPRAITPVDQLELPLGLPAAPEPVASTNTVPRAGWDGLTENFSSKPTDYGSGYGVIERPEMAPVAGAMEAFMPIAQRLTFDDPEQAALVVETAMRTANPGPDGRVGAEQVIGKIMEIANPPMASGRPAGYAGPAPVMPETIRRKVTSLARPTGQVETDVTNVYAQALAAAERAPVGGELSPVPWKRAVAGPAPVAQAPLPAGAIDAAARGYGQAVGASMPAPQGQGWIPGLPSADAAFRARVNPGYEREMAYWNRAGKRAYAEQGLSGYGAPQADMAMTPAQRLMQALAEENAYRSSARSGYAPRARVEQLGIPGWPSAFSA